MAEDKKKVIVYADWITKFEALEDAEAGKLIKHFFRYINDLNPKYPDRITEISFIDIQNTLKRDLIKWEKRAEKSRENGMSGGRPKNLIKPKETNQVILEPTKPVNDSVSDSVSVNVKDNKYNISPEVKKLRGDCKNYFLDYYLQKKGSEFYWSTKDAANLNKLIAKVEFKVKEKNGSNYTNEDILVGFKLILSNIKDNWIIDNLSIPNINSKFNEIFTQITNGKTSKDKYASSEFRN